jgi:hypothetical protein
VPDGKTSSAPIRPASIFLVPSCAIGADLVEKSLPDIFPDSVRPTVFDRVRFLDFDDAETAQALDAQHMARNFRKPKLLDRQPWFSSGAGSLCGPRIFAASCSPRRRIAA